MTYVWKRTLCRNRRLEVKTCPVFRTALCLIGTVYEVQEAVKNLDDRLEESVDIWMSPIHARFKPVLEKQNRVRRVYLCPNEKPVNELRRGDRYQVQVYGRYEKIMVWGNGEMNEGVTK